MKKIKIFAICALSGFVFASCGGNKTALDSAFTRAEIDSTSYAVGVSFGGMLKNSNMTNLNYNKVLSAIQDVVNGKETKISENEVGQIIQAYMAKASEAIGKQKEQEQEAFFAENKKNEGVIQTESGLQYLIENEGNGVKPAVTDTVEVHYKGALLDGSVFDSTYDRGETIKFPLNRVIPGWTEGLQLIGEGGKAKLWIPYQLGYGPRSMSPELPAYSTLVFDVELIKVYKDSSEE